MVGLPLLAQTPLNGALSGTLPAGVFHTTANISVTAGATLVLQAGVIIKLDGHQFTVDGTLLAQGTAANPVIFTHLQDDSAGGDTNGNGPSTGQPGGWYGIHLHDGSDASVFEHAEVRYGGLNQVSNLELEQSRATFLHCTVRNCLVSGMDLNATSRPTVSDCAFVDNGGCAVQNASIDAVPGFSYNVANGNGNGTLNYMVVGAGAVTSNVTIGPAQMINNVLVVDAHVFVADGAMLTFAAGTIVKFAKTHLVTVEGTLRVDGTAVNPCVFTDLRDDSAGGDTNGNGPSTGLPSSWYGFALRPASDASALTWADVRYGGCDAMANFELDQSDATFDHCTVRNGSAAGMDLHANSRPTVSHCAFVDNGSYAVHNVPIDAVPGFTYNTASGNADGTRDYMFVSSGAVTGAVRIGTQSVLNGALVLGAHVTVPVGASLTLEQGVVCKLAAAARVVVDGACYGLGTSYEPVVFTALADDQCAGDTNGDGPSAGSPGAWYGLLCNATAFGSLENVVVRYGGFGFVAGVDCASEWLALRAVRTDRCLGDGFVLSAAANHPSNLVAWGCGASGIWLTGGQLQLHHATAAGNGVGIRAEAGWIGRVVNSIAWGNGTNFLNLAPSQVTCSDGFTGGTGNLDVDPEFVDATNGDLHLSATSPCVGVADLANAIRTAKDHDENSRVTDHRVHYFALADMGAFECQAWAMTVTGVPRPGSTVTFQLTGPTGYSFWTWGVMDGMQWVDPWGIVTAGLPGQTAFLLLPWPVPVGTPVPLPLVNDPAIVGAVAGIQTLTLGTMGLAGNFTRLYRGLVRP